MTGPDGSAHARRPSGTRLARGLGAHRRRRRPGVEVVLTHGNGPQVGNLLVKNELAAHVVPPVPLDWCVAQTQATIAFTLADELDAALAARGLSQRTAALVTRTLVDADDPGFASRPSRSAASCPRGGRAVHRARPGLGGPRREGLAPGRRLARAARRSSTRRRSTPWPPPGSSSSAPAAAASRSSDDGLDGDGAARRRGRHRQGPDRRDPRPRGGRRHAGDRHRRPERDGRLRHAVARGRSAGSPSPSCASTPPPASSPAAAWAPRSTPHCASSSRAAAPRAVITSLEHIADAVARRRRRHRPRPTFRAEGPRPPRGTRARTDRGPQGPAAQRQ